jgi:RNA polymerase sigma-70 factor (ECF subfamily)
MTYSTHKVWEEFSGRLRAFILGRIADPADADDILQEVFLKVHTRLETLRDEDRMVPWLYQVARNAIIDHYRARQPSAGIPETLMVEDEPDEGDPAAELADGLRDFMACLPDKYRQALVLSELGDLSQVELAERLGLSHSGAKSRVQRARRLLRDALLDCCHFEFDRRRHVIDMVPRVDCCSHCKA